MTEKIYETDGMCFSFRAHILSAVPHGDGYAVVLDRTAFFPEGGGQTADTGRIGDARVLDVQIRDGEILHFTDKCPRETDVLCELDREERFRKMQNHLGEHLLCGAIHTLYGYDNVGFHLGADYMTFDIDGVMTPEQIDEAESLANRAIAEDAPVRCYFPSEDERKALSYRAKSEKLEAAEKIRIVEVEGFDRCACCAPHLDRAGKVGLIKIVDAMHYKGGMRFFAFCGFAALADYHKRLGQVRAVSALLSAKPDDVVPAVQKRLDEISALRREIGALKHAHAALLCQTVMPTDGNLCLFDEMLDANTMRELSNGLIDRAGGIVAVFSGNDEDGYQFVLTSATVPLKEKMNDIRAALGGKCGGSPSMLFGHAEATEAEIRAYFG